MKFFAAVLLLTGTIAAAYDACSSGGLYTNPQCCSVSVLGLANLDCTPPPRTPVDAGDFKAACAGGGMQATCCVLPVADQSVLCEKPVGV